MATWLNTESIDHAHVLVIYLFDDKYWPMAEPIWYKPQVFHPVVYLHVIYDVTVGMAEYVLVW